MQPVLFAMVLVAGLVGWGGAHAQVFKCTAANGATKFQDRTCAASERQQVVPLPARGPPGYVPPPGATAGPPVASTPVLPSPVYAPPPVPLPVIFACVGAVNGKRYLARTPPPPYLAPLGVMGYPPQSLSQAYGSPGGAGMSTPDSAHPRIGGPPAATGMAEVEDACVPATRADVCSFVQNEFDDNQHRLNLAMPHERPPLERRQRELDDQLRNCR